MPESILEVMREDKPLVMREGMLRAGSASSRGLSGGTDNPRPAG